MIAMMIMAISLTVFIPTLTGWGWIRGVTERGVIPTLTGWGWMGPGWGAMSAAWGGVFNHLWQSTVFAAVAALLALALRKNHARARYWLWLAASCKFLVPFSLLVSLGVSVGTSIEGVVEKLWPSAPAIVVQPEMTIMFDEISQPFTLATVPIEAPARQSILSAILPEVLFGLWACGCAIVLIRWCRRWSRVRAAVCAAKPIDIELPVQLNMGAEVFSHPLPDGRGSVSERLAEMRGGVDGKKPQAYAWGWKGMIPALTGRGWRAPQGIRIMSSPALIEPGIFGIFRPVLLLPEGIADRLTPAQLKSILAHELCHVRRRDNLAAAIHMIVEATFWFHPLVWWIGARLVEERERACDEEVLRSGSEPGVYAESILQVCKFYLESPLKCVAGVTGSDLKKRIESIMSGLPGRNLSRTRKLLLVAASIGAIAGPVIFGVLAAPHIRAQSQPGQEKEHLAFEVASVKPNKTADNRSMRIESLPGGGFSAKGVPLYLLIVFAYNLPIQTPRISGGPEWLRSDRFDIEAKADKDAIPKGATTKTREAMTRLMLQTLLAERFKLVIRIDKKELPVYAAVVGKNGPKLQKSKIDEKDCPDSGTTVAGTTCHTFFGGMGRGLHGDAVDMEDLVQFVANWTDRPVIDKTGIQGLYNIQTDGWTRMVPSQPSPDGTVSDEAQALADPARPTLQMIFDRLGLKLESQKAPIDMYVIVSAEKPSDNFEPPVAAAQFAGQSAIFQMAFQQGSSQSAAAAGPTPKWEVVSVKPCDPSTPQGRSGGGGGGGFSPGTLTANCAVPIRLIEEAYGFYANGRTPTWKIAPIEGAPSWLDSERYTIAAKSESPQGRAMMFGPMMQKLLEDRFKLKMRREIREVPVYNLTIAKGGPKYLKASKPGTCVALDMDNPPPPSGDLCKMFSRRRVAEGEREFKELGVTMAEFSDALAAMTGRNVVDKTGLSGTFDIEAQVSLPDDPPRDPSQPRTGPLDESDLVFAVVQKLGMKLESARGPGVVYVIEHVEKPSDNFEPPVAAARTSWLPAAAFATQEPAQGRPAVSFEVASIKRNNSGDRTSGIPPAVNGRFRAINVPVREVIGYAYHTMNPSRISGGPGWLDTERYDIQAKAEENIPEEKIRPMVLRLLQDRFALKLHHEQKQMQAYVMTVAKGGPKFKVSGACVEDPEQKRPCGGFRVQHRSYVGGQQVSSADLAEVLEALLDQPVIDRTGIKGVFNMTLEWTPDERSPSGNDVGVAPVNAERPSLFAAMQEQLGLKLDVQKAAVDVVVVDHAEKPSDNFEPPVAKQQEALQQHALHTVAPLAPQVTVAAKPQGRPTAAVEKPRAFEVATIKPCGNGDAGGGARGARGGGDGNGPSPDRLNLPCQPVMLLIRMAYLNFAGGHMNPRNTTPVDGGPTWVNSDRYQITAKAEGTPGMEMMRGPMLQALLEDRFKLKIRRESREVPAYAMTVARGGPKLKPFQEGSCVPFTGVGGLPRPGPDGKLPVLCAMRSMRNPLNGSPSTWDLPGESLDGFAKALGDDMDRIVINKTGLAGKFDFRLEFTPDESTPSIVNALRQRAEQNNEPVAAASDPSGGLSIFTAIQQQLGLKLDGSKGAREFLVIDRIERPTEN